MNDQEGTSKHVARRGMKSTSLGKSPRLTWSREPNETGLARVCQLERGRILKVSGVKVGYAGAVYKPWSRVVAGYYWYTGDDGLQIERQNTAGTPVATLEDAQKACEAYVRECLAKHLPKVTS